MKFFFLITKDTIQTHGWELLPHPLYSSIWHQRISTSFDLFLMLCTEFCLILQYFNLFEHWEVVVNNKGEYIIDYLALLKNNHLKKKFLKQQELNYQPNK